jgi:hypothetical protein
VPEGTLLLQREILLPHIFVGDEAYPLTVYTMKQYSRRAIDRSEAIFNYSPSRARLVVEWAFGICASKWKILEKAFDTKVDLDVDIVKCVALLHNIITYVEGLKDFCQMIVTV